MGRGVNPEYFDLKKSVERQTTFECHELLRGFSAARVLIFIRIGQEMAGKWAKLICPYMDIHSQFDSFSP